MELDSVARILRAFYRLVKTKPDDGALTEQGEAADEVAYTYLTRGVRAAQRYMIAAGMQDRWRKRSPALSWAGSDAADGGRYASLPADFLRLDGDQKRRSALVQPDGCSWGAEVTGDTDEARGGFYYLKNEQLWLARGACPPSTLLLRYFFKHPAFDDLADADIDFPEDARPLIVAEAADAAKDEGWFLGDLADRGAIERALAKAQREARDVVRRTRAPRSFRQAPQYGSHW